VHDFGTTVVPNSIWDKPGSLTRAELEQFDGEIRSFYLHVRDTIVNPAMPQVRNSDGEPLRFVALSFDLSVPVADAYARLLPLATLDGEVHDQNVVRDAAGAVTAAAARTPSAPPQSHTLLRAST